jgi:ABC-2 type transport system permease protein
MGGAAHSYERVGELRLMGQLQVLRYAIVSGFADYAAIFTWRTWLLGWLSRVLCQVAFFALIGRLLDSPEQEHFLLVGNAVFIAAMEAMMVVASSTWERRSGTLALLVAAPTGPLLVFAGRSLFNVVSGTVSASVALFALAPVFGVPLPMPAALAVLPLIALVSLSTYCAGLALAALVLRAVQLRNIAGNLGYLMLMTFGGVQVPLDFWPEPVRRVTDLLPLTHGLDAARGVLAAMPPAEVLRHAMLEAAVGVCWLFVAALLFGHLADSGRRTGTIEFGD